jgi:hypothetical protein
MTYIFKSGNSSEMIRFHKDINTHIYGGGNVSHILHVIINEPTTNDNDNDIMNQIRQRVFHKINNVPITFNINNLNVVITWRSNNNLNYYHADVMGIYGDVAVKLHTDMLLTIFDNIGEYDDEDSSWESGLAFMVTKPLFRTVPIIPC